MKEGKVTEMNLDALAKAGRLPWSPNPTARDLDVWDEYEHPRAGTFTIDGTTVFFLALTAVGERLSLWAYTCLTSKEAHELAVAEFDSTASLREFAERLLDDRRVVFVLADDLIIRRWSVADSKGPIDERAIDFLNSVLESVKDNRHPTRMITAKLAEVDVATTELVDA